MITKRLTETRAARLEQLAQGAATFDQYKFDTGFLAGLKEGLELVKEVHKKMFGAED